MTTTAGTVLAILSFFLAPIMFMGVAGAKMLLTPQELRREETLLAQFIWVGLFSWGTAFGILLHFGIDRL